MSKRQISITAVTGTRAEYGLLKPLILQLHRPPEFNVQLLVTGMHTLKKFGATLGDIRRDGLPIAGVVRIAEGNDMLQNLAQEIRGIRDFCERRTIDAFLVLGDRDEAFAAAIVGIHRNIPVIHISGGDRSGETVDHYLRNAITGFSKLHLTQTRLSRLNVLQLGAEQSRTAVVGSLGLDGLTRRSLLPRETVTRALGLRQDRPWYFILMHPTPFEQTTIPKQINPLIEIVRHLDGERVIIYPNSDNGSAYFIRRITTLAGRPSVLIRPNLQRQLFLSLLAQSVVFIGNSSCGLIEAAHLRVPFVNIGNRQQHREYGKNVVPTNYDSSSIRRAIARALSPAFQRRLRRVSSPYRGGPVAARAAQAIIRFLRR